MDTQQQSQAVAIHTNQTGANDISVAEGVAEGVAHMLDCSNGQAVGYMETVGALCARDYKGVGSQYVQEGKDLALPMVMAHGQGGSEIREGQAPCLTCNHEAPILFDVHSQDSRVTGPHETSPTVVGKWGTGGGNTPLAVCTGSDVARTLTARNDGSPCAARGQETECVAFTWQGGTGFRTSDDMAGTLTKSQTEAVAFAQNQEGELRTSETMNTLGTTQSASGPATGKVVVPLNTMAIQGRPSDDTNPRMGSGIGKPGDPCPTLTKGHSHAVQHGYTVRRITPIEAEFLQGFPRNWTQIPYRGKPAELCPDGPRYKALGNSWAVPVARWVFERIDKVDKL